MWWDSMSALQQTLFIVACAATFLLVMQIVLMLIGGETDGADGMDGIGADGALDGDVSDFGGVSDIGDVDGADGVTETNGSSFGFRLMSVRSAIAFTAVGGWVGYTLCYSLDWYYAVIIAVVCGLVAACVMAVAIMGMQKLQSSGTINPQNAVGKQGEVYLTVPPSRSGKGKVNILIQERYAEYEAVTDSDEPLPTASSVKVTAHIGSNVLLVEKYKKPSITVENIK